MYTLDELLNASDQAAKGYALYLVQNDGSISSLIRCLSDENLREFLKNIIALSLGEVGTPVAVKHLIKLYQESEENSTSRFYATYALGVYALHHHFISPEVRHILLDALSCSDKKIREIATFSQLPHHVENVLPLLKYLYLEYPEADESDWCDGGSLEYGCNYFKFANDEEIEKLKEIFLTANEEEMIALSIAIPSIRSKNMNFMIRPLLLKIKDGELKKLLIYSLGWNTHFDDANITFLEDLRTQEPPEIQIVIDSTLEFLKIK